MKTEAQPIRIFIAYSHKDYAFLEEMRTAAVPLERSGKVRIWYDGKIEAGTVWDTEIKDNLHASDIILLLVSSNSLASDYFYEREVADALERHRRGETRVIPVIISHCFWDETPLYELQAVPSGARPVNTWPDRHEAWHNVLSRIRDTIHEINEARTTAKKTEPPVLSARQPEENPGKLQNIAAAANPLHSSPQAQKKSEPDTLDKKQSAAKAASPKRQLQWKASLLSKSKLARTIEVSHSENTIILEVSRTAAVFSEVHIKLNDRLIHKKAMPLFDEYVSGEFHFDFNLKIGGAQYPAHIRLDSSIWSGTISGLVLSIEDVSVYSE